MIFELSCLNGSNFTFSNPISVSISMSEETPADSLSLNYPVDPELINKYSLYKEELSHIKVYSEQDSSLIFNGSIDEQSLELSNNGATLTIHARSLASVLLDNEAQPQIYEVPTTELIFERHARPYGFTEFTGSNLSFSDQFIVSKGLCEWQVISNFSKTFLNTKPYVNNLGVINFTPEIKNSGITFSNYKNSALRYTEIAIDYKRCKPLSEIFIRTDKNGSYSTIVSDALAINKGITRKRYVNATDNVKDPIAKCERLLMDARLDAFKIKLICPYAIPVAIFSSVSLFDSYLGSFSELVVSDISYKLNSSGEKSIITLRQK